MYKTTVTLKKGQGRTLKAGGLWFFDNEIAKIDGKFVDLTTKIENDCELQLVTLRDKEGLEVYRHTCAHV
ncbi:MAG: hypothetical protein SOT10_00945, partial [Oscillospiraceae bacterium]|nr:hypothetical protein [Oscillospiraceae bacterium]